jgi:transcription initiation factor IIF auxiliary subunit
METTMKIRNILTALITAGFLASPMAMAQGEQQAQPMPQQQEAPEVSESQINAFVEAYIAVSEVREEYTARLQEAEDQEQAQQLQQEANDAMTAAIEDNGMSIEEYQEVAMAVNADADVREQVTTMLEERGAL